VILIKDHWHLDDPMIIIIIMSSLIIRMVITLMTSNVAF